MEKYLNLIEKNKEGNLTREEFIAVLYRALHRNIIE